MSKFGVNPIHIVSLNPEKNLSISCYGTINLNLHRLIFLGYFINIILYKRATFNKAHYNRKSNND